MEEQDKTGNDKKKAMKALRAQRRDLIAKAVSIMKVQKKEIKAIKDCLAEEDATVPDIAKATGMPTDRALWYIATMKKYGEVLESQKEGAFFKYTLNEQKL